MASAWRTTPHHLVWAHTMLPYATAFLQEAAYHRAMDNALSTATQRTGLGAVTQSTTSYVTACRFCQVCVEQDVATWGDSYWRRAHHLPGVLVCPTHGRPLVVTTLATVSRVLLDRLPHDLVVPAPKWRPSGLELRLAQVSLTALNRPVGPAAEPTAAGYRQRMVQAGLLTEGRHVDSMRLLAWLKDSMGGDQCQRILSNAEGDLRWIPRLLSSRQCSMHPAARHLLFNCLIDAAPTSHTPLLDFTPAVSRPSRMVEMDAKFAAAAKKLVQEAIRRGERVRVRDALTQVGCWTSFRHHPQNFPKLQAFVLWLKASPACMRPNWGRGGTPRARSVMRNRR